MGRSEDFLFGVFIGAAISCFVTAWICGGIVSAARDDVWCTRIAKSQMPTTFAECLSDFAEVAKQ